MSERMIPVSFEKMLHSLIEEYQEKGSFYDVPVIPNSSNAPIGVAAGPHTQLAGNLLAAYAAGANYLELKTVQILQGKVLGIVKPCIEVSHEVYNTEWSTELALAEARDEYIKAYLLIAVLSRLFHLRPAGAVHFIASVGYDLKGIQSRAVDDFIESMKQAGRTKEWQKDIAYLRVQNGKAFHLSEEELSQIESQDRITHTVTLSTMHGCLSSEIEAIADYLMREKEMDTFIKLNPTLIGRQEIVSLLKQKGYDEIEVAEEVFQTELTLEQAAELVKKLAQTGRKLKQLFGIKMTNTLPVKNQKGHLKGETAYLSGVPLFPIAIRAAAELMIRIEEEIPVSYSGGIDLGNIDQVLKTGIAPITVSSFLLKPGGYKNLTRLMTKSADYSYKALNRHSLKALAEAAAVSRDYDNRPYKPFAIKDGYTRLCGQCHNCVDICPNRANVPFYIAHKKYVLHLDSLCNECGACQCECIMGHIPYQEKFTIYTDWESFAISKTPCALYEGKELIISDHENIKIPVQQIKKIVKSRLEAGRNSYGI